MGEQAKVSDPFEQHCQRYQDVREFCQAYPEVKNHVQSSIDHETCRKAAITVLTFICKYPEVVSENLETTERKKYRDVLREIPNASETGTAGGESASGESEKTQVLKDLTGQFIEARQWLTT